MSLDEKITSLEQLSNIVACESAVVRGAFQLYVDEYQCSNEKVLERDWWEIREHIRFRERIYREIPIDVTREIVRSLPSGHDYWARVDQHHVHASIDEPGMIAYTPDAEHGQADRQIRTKIGRWLRRLELNIPEPAIAKISAMLRAEMAPVEVLFADTEAEISKVYDQGPRSCMGGEGREFDPEVAPERVYAGPDTMVAYTVRAGRINSRAVVRKDCDPPKYLRAYGDETTLEDGLKDLGYVRTNTLEGVRLAMHKYNGEYVMPYLDGDAISVSEYTDETGTYWQVKDDYEGYYSAQNLNGFIDENVASGAYCDWHGDHTQATISHNSYTGHNVCSECIEQHFVPAFAGRYMEDVPEDEMVYEYAGDYYTDSGLEYHGLIELSSGDIIPKDEAVRDNIDEEMVAEADTTEYFEEADGKALYTVHDDLLVYSNAHGCQILESEAHQLSTGDWVFETDDDLISQDEDQIQLAI